MRGRLAGLGIALAIVIPTLAQSHYTPPRTPWGDPDLQGLWPGNMGVPMQRPATFGDRSSPTMNSRGVRRRPPRRPKPMRSCS